MVGLTAPHPAVTAEAAVGDADIDAGKLDAWLEPFLTATGRKTRRTSSAGRSKKSGASPRGSRSGASGQP